MMRHPCLKLAIWVLTPLVAKGDRESVIGDLVEEYAGRSQEGSSTAAVRWCVRQVGASILPLLRLRLARAHWPATLAIALLAYLSVAIAQVAIHFALPASSPHRAVAQLLLAFPAVVLIAWIAERIRDRSAMVLAVMMFLAMTAMTLLVPEEAPFWQRAAYFIVGPAAAFMGRALHRRRKPALHP